MFCCKLYSQPSRRVMSNAFRKLGIIFASYWADVLTVYEYLVIEDSTDWNLNLTLWILESRNWIPDCLTVELGFHISFLELNSGFRLQHYLVLGNRGIRPGQTPM